MVSKEQEKLRNFQKDRFLHTRSHPKGWFFDNLKILLKTGYTNLISLKRPSLCLKRVWGNYLGSLYINFSLIKVWVIM